MIAASDKPIGLEIHEGNNQRCGRQIHGWEGPPLTKEGFPSPARFFSFYFYFWRLTILRISALLLLLVIKVHLSSPHFAVLPK